MPLELGLCVRTQRNDFEALAAGVFDGSRDEHLADAPTAQRIGHFGVVDDDQDR